MKQVLVIADPSSKTADWSEEVLASRSDLSVIRLSREQFREIHIFHGQKFEGIVFDCAVLDETEFSFLRSLSVAAQTPPILIFSTQINIYSYAQVHAMENMVALQSPSDPRVFTSMLDKVM